MKAAINAWNKAILLRNPSLCDLKNSLTIDSTYRVFESVPDMLYTGDNCLIRLPMGHDQRHSDPLVTSFSILLDSNYFVNSTVKVVNVATCRVFDTSLNAPARLLAERFGAMNFARITATTELRKGFVSCDTSLKFEFHPSEGYIFDVNTSRIVAIHFFYKPYYTAAKIPFIELEDTDLVFSPKK